MRTLSTVCRSTLFSFLSCLLFIFSSPASSEIYPDMNFEGAVWVAESDGILKVATADGTILFEIPDAVGTRVVAVDTQRGVLWAYGKNHLSAFDFAGTMRVRVPLSVSTSKSDDDKDDHEDDGDEHCILTCASGSFCWQALRRFGSPWK